MHHYPTLQTIDTDCIDLSNRWSLHTFLPDKVSPKLQHSIHTFGLLHPPILHKLTNTNYQVISGLSRLHASLPDSSPNNSIIALILDESAPVRTLLHYIIKDQSLSGPLSPMEKACFFRLCLKHNSLEETIDIYSSTLDEKIQSHTINRLLSLLELEEGIQESIHFGQIGEKIGLELHQLSPSDRSILYRIFQDLELGNGKQKRLLTLSRELAFRQGKTITTLLTEPDYNALLDHPEMNPPQKATALLSTLQKNLFPESNKAEELFQKAVHKMELPATCTISHSPAFERDEVYLTLHFKTLEEIGNRLEEIKTLGKQQ